MAINQNFQVKNGLSVGVGGTYLISSGSSIGIGTTRPLYTLSVSNSGVTALSGLTNCLIDGTANTNSYTQINVRNASNGSNASGDFIITADNGSDSTQYIDLGINNSGFSLGSWTINGANDGYLYASDGNFSVGTAGSKYLSFFTGGTLASNERMRITGSGNIGIGTTNPSQALHVVGNSIITGARYDSNNTGGTYGQVLTSTGTGTSWNGTITISSGSSIGIGTTTPTTPLSVNGYITENPGDGVYWNVVTQKDIGIAGNQIPLNQYLGTMAFQDANAINVNTLSIGVGGTVLFNSGQYIGIGTTNPTRVVQIVGDATSNPFNAALSVATGNTSTGYGAYLGLNATSLTNGRDWRLISSGASNSAGIGVFSIYDNTAGLDRVVVGSGGSVGIGTTTPSSLLQVNGVIQDNIGKVRAYPQNPQAAAYTLVSTDAGKHISAGAGVTVPASVFSTGDYVLVYNNTAGFITISQGASVTLRLAGTSTTGSRTLATYGVANILCVTGGATPTFVCYGTGLT